MLFELDGLGQILSYRAPHDGELYLPPEKFVGKRVFDILPPAIFSLWERLVQPAAGGIPYSNASM